MRVVSLQDTLEGSYLAVPIHGDGGRLMLGTDTRLTKRLIRVLQSRGYTKVAIRDPLLEDIEPDDAIDIQTRAQTKAALDKAVTKLVAGQTPDLNEVFHAVDAVIADLWSNFRTSSSIVSIQSYDMDTYTHCINVCILSICIGYNLGWPLSKLRKLGTAALLHDVGKILLPINVLNKPNDLTNEEYAIVKTHCEKGWELLSGCFNTDGFVAQSAMEHHERLNGSGYPRHLGEEKISDVGKITAVADVFDAMTTDRPQRKAILPEAVYSYMSQAKGELFDAKIVDILFNNVALYPTGTILSLWGGYLAVVTAQDPRSGFRPFVRIIGGPGITKPIDISLYSRPDIKINLLLDDYPSDAKRIITDDFNENIFLDDT